MNLHGIKQAVDVILVTPEQVERYQNYPLLDNSASVAETVGRILSCLSVPS